ncbi:2-hydroxymuconate tautomerase family protein [Helicobacter pylori]|uniref:2-hydroxymuconate tautomerase family protein n=1 Tax=Helicobacter pylori TaxID=210 RepID=UPI000BEAB4EE|nr:2-hydroxymuconate tautomerase family protein [Helicobacter pylori]PDW75414.1 tautomerase [Helicobacter pylori]
MPFINIKLVPENGGPTNEQKQQLIEEVSDLMVKVLNKNKASIVVPLKTINITHIKHHKAFEKEGSV